MTLPSFQLSMIEFIEPWKTLVQIVGDNFESGYFENFVILGKYSDDEQVTMNAWSIVGLAPGHQDFLECKLVSGSTEQDKAFWISEMRDVLSVLSLPEYSNTKRVQLLGDIIHASLGVEKCHVIGMLSIHQTVRSKQSFAVLWKHPKISRPLVEEIMRYVLND